MSTQNRTQQKVAQLLGLLQSAKTLLIVMQDNPDPDAVAAAGALRQVANQKAGVSCTIGHGGAVGRAENRALVRYLSLKLRPLEELKAEKFDLVAMVDTQPQTGNNSLAPGTKVDMVFDHHPMRKETRSARFADVRRAYGATSTVMYEYLNHLAIQPDAPLATALCYGIRSDTQDLGRDSTEADIAAYLALYPQANKRMLGRIQREPAPPAYFRTLARGLNRARVHGHCIVAPLGGVDCPESVAEMADLLLRCEGVDWTLAYGIFRKTMHLSMRTNAQGDDAGKAMASAVRGYGTGGGHESLAGGQIDVSGMDAEARKKMDAAVLRRFLGRLGVDDREGKSLLSRGPQDG